MTAVVPPPEKMALTSPLNTLLTGLPAEPLMLMPLLFNFTCDKPLTL